MLNKIKGKIESSINTLKVKISAFIECCRKLIAVAAGVCLGVFIIAALVALIMLTITIAGPVIPFALVVVIAIVCTFTSGAIMIPLILALSASRKTYSFLGGRCDKAFGGESTSISK